MNSLDKELDRVKSQVFLDKNAAMLGCILCSLEFSWDRSIPTVATNGKYLKWNPDWFMSLPQETRGTVLVHELWHVARLHSLRRDTRSPKQWNWACDIVINNGLQDDKYTFTGTKPWINQDYSGKSEEEIYDLLMENQEEMSNSPWLGEAEDEELDLDEPTPTEAREIIDTVVQSVQTARMMGCTTNQVGIISELIDKFMKPMIPWRTVLYRWFEERLSDEVSWKRPNRRYQHMYMPSKTVDDSALKSLNYYFDVSGSVTTEQVQQFNTELKYIKDVFNPEKLSIIQFDTAIRDVLVVESNDAFDKLQVTGRGGTSLIPVRNHIAETMPTAAIIFSDLFCKPMVPPDVKVPIIWVVIDNPKASPSFGKVIHIGIDS